MYVRVHACTRTRACTQVVCPFGCAANIRVQLLSVWKCLVLFAALRARSLILLKYMYIVGDIRGRMVCFVHFLTA